MASVEGLTKTTITLTLLCNELNPCRYIWQGKLNVGILTLVVVYFDQWTGALLAGQIICFCVKTNALMEEKERKKRKA